MATTHGDDAHDTGAVDMSWTDADGTGVAPDPGDQKRVPGPFLFENWRCGPKVIPHDSHIMNVLLQGYKPFGEIEPRDFLKLYYSDPVSQPIWPSDNGFKPKTTRKTSKLEAGKHLLDRFGRETGNFVGYVGLTFSQRALPPAYLTFLNIPLKDRYNYINDGDKDGYRVYEILKDIEVEEGFVAPWFQQADDGWQVMLTKTKELTSVADFVKHGYLKRWTWTQIEAYHKKVDDEIQSKNETKAKKIREEFKKIEEDLKDKNVLDDEIRAILKKAAESVADDPLLRASMAAEEVLTTDYGFLAPTAFAMLR